MIVNEIFDHVDLDYTGRINKEDWIVATIDKERIMQPKKLYEAFNYLDVDGDGSISLDEFLETLF